MFFVNQEVKFGKQAKKGASLQKTKFLMLHLNLLREYLELEFVSVKPKLFNFPYDLDRIIDDWVSQIFCTVFRNSPIIRRFNFRSSW